MGNIEYLMLAAVRVVHPLIVILHVKEITVSGETESVGWKILSASTATDYVDEQRFFYEVIILCENQPLVVIVLYVC